jgi:hypothetical protein
MCPAHAIPSLCAGTVLGVVGCHEFVCQLTQSRESDW